MRKIIENFRIAAKSIWSNKTRSFLTTLGIIIGVFSVILLVAIGSGAKNQISDQLTSFGTNIFFVVPGKIDASNMSNFNPASSISNKTLTIEDAKNIEKSEFVKNVIPVSLVSGQAKNKDKISIKSIVTGTWPGIFDLKDMAPQKGRSFNKQDVDNKNMVAVLGNNSAKDLFGDEDPVGKKINLSGRNLEVIGAMDKSPTTVRIFGFDFDNIVYLPYSSAQEINKEGPLQIFRFIIQTKSNDNINPAAEDVKNIMSLSHNGNDDFTIMRQEDILKILDSILSVLTLMISAIAAISLIVGGIGIMNIMLVSVTERTKEIGLRKAVGANRSDILMQFLIESILISIFGGSLGVGLAYFVSFIIGKYSNFHPYLSLNSILLSFLVAFFVGVIFGVAPAVRASRLDPIDALRHD